MAVSLKREVTKNHNITKFIANLKSIKMDEIGVQVVQSGGEKQFKQDADPTAAAGAEDYLHGQYSPTSKQQKLAMKQLYNQYSGRTSLNRFDGQMLARYQLSNRQTDKMNSNQMPTPYRDRTTF